jgi:hypothetical protein
MKKNIFYICIIIGLFLALYFFIDIPIPNKQAKCPDDYKTSEEQMTALNEWTNNFYDDHPGASLGDWNRARYQFWVDNRCTEALKRYNEAKSGKADPETMNFIKETIINN